MRVRGLLPGLLGLSGVLILPALPAVVLADEGGGDSASAPSVEKSASGLSVKPKPGESATVVIRPGSTTATTVDARGQTTTETLHEAPGSDPKTVRIEAQPGSRTTVVTRTAPPVAAAAKPIAVAAKPSLPKLVPIYFRTDSAEIEDISVPLLDATAEALKGNTQQSVAIQGHADERGSDEHNADLTERRAQAVSQALQARGVSASRLQPTGYGSENPVCSGSSEDCWSQNRRVDIVPPPSASDAR